MLIAHLYACEFVILHYAPLERLRYMYYYIWGLRCKRVPMCGRVWGYHYYIKLCAAI